MGEKIFKIFFQILAFVALLFVFPAEIYSQTPSYFNLGGAAPSSVPTIFNGGPTLSSMPLISGQQSVPTNANPSIAGQVTPQITPGGATSSPTPNCAPVLADSASAQSEATANYHRRRSRGGKNSNKQGLIQQLLNLIQQLIQMIQQLIGGGSFNPQVPSGGTPVPTQGQGQQAPTSNPQNPNATLPPCPTSTPGANQGNNQPTSAQPTTAQSSPAPSQPQSTVPPAAGGTPAQSASEPILPTANGPCPEFKTGVVTFTPKNAPANQAQLYVGSNPSNGPLVFYFHGTGEGSSFSSSGPSWLGQSVIDDITAKGGVAIVPKGHGGYEWLIANGDTSEEDLFLVDEMVACAIEKAKIDPKKIYSTGLSSGATLTSDLIHRRSNYLAAGAPQSGGWDPYNPIPANQNPNNKIAAMIIHGGPSDSWPSNACEVYEPQSIIMANKLLQEGGFPILCNQGGGHRNIPDREAVWTFFQAHPFNVTPKPWANGLPGGFPSYCEVYKGDKQASMPSSCAY